MRSYEELVGAKGRRMFYRAERYRAKDLFKRTMPDLAIDDLSYTLHDLSMNGVGAYAPRGHNDLCDVGTRVKVALSFKGVTLHDGTGQVSRIEPTPFGPKVGIQLLEQCLNISQLVAKYQEAIVRTDLDADFAKSEALVPAEYRQICADVVHLLRVYRASLAKFGEAHPDAAADAEMFAACEQKLLPRWRGLWFRANEIVGEVMTDPAALAATKRFTEFVVTPEFMSGPICRRSYEKPLGYPGDFEVMNQIYAWRRAGDGLYEQLLHRIGLDIGECIVNRMVMMRQAIAETVLRRRPGTARVTSLGCGPAREVVDYLEMRELPTPVQFTLIDQEHAALGQAYEQAYPAVLRHKGQATVNCLHASFAELLRAGELFGKLPPQDLIYSAGLTDYVADKRTRALIAALWDQLAPHGTLVIGNMAQSPEGNLWPMEFICDWTMIYRNEANMAALAEGLVGAEIATVRDATGRVCLLTCRKV